MKFWRDTGSDQPVWCGLRQLLLPDHTHYENGKGNPPLLSHCVYVCMLSEVRGRPAGAGPLPPHLSPADPTLVFPAEPCHQPFPEEDLGRPITGYSGTLRWPCLQGTCGLYTSR